jgi:hypothetical protein
MAKEYSPPNRKEDDENERLKQHQQNNPQASSRVAGDKTAHPGDRSTGDPAHEYDERAAKEAQMATDKANKEREEYMGKLKASTDAILNAAGGTNNPQMVNLTVEALKNAACQLEASTPQGSQHGTQHTNL